MTKNNQLLRLFKSEFSLSVVFHFFCNHAQYDFPIFHCPNSLIWLLLMNMVLHFKRANVRSSDVLSPYALFCRCLGASAKTDSFYATVQFLYFLPGCSCSSAKKSKMQKYKKTKLHNYIITDIYKSTKIHRA